MTERDPRRRFSRRERVALLHRRLNDMCGDTLPTASVASLEKRITELRSWL